MIDTESHGCSGRFLSKVSISIRRAPQYSPSSLPLRVISVINEVCKIRSGDGQRLSLNVQKGSFSKIGNTGLVVTTPLMGRKAASVTQKRKQEFHNLGFF